MKCFKKACRGEKGFTLIELLVVIMILGVLAAVVTLAVTKFIGKGTLESANAELVTVQTAIEACLADANSAKFDGTGNYLWSGGKTEGCQCPVVTKSGEKFYVQDYLRTSKLKAQYTITPEGAIDSANPEIDGGWGNSISFSKDNVTWY